MLQRPLPSLESWVSYLSQADIPVLKRTARELARLRENEENISGRQLAGVILHDPLMTLRVLAYIEASRRRSQTTDITTIDRAVMMIGVTPFFAKFENLPLVEDVLKDQPQALIGLLRVITRARQASIFARDWAVLRHDLDVEEITVATLLHDTAEILLWCFAPTLMLGIRTLQAENRGMRSAVAQQTALGITASELQLALARTWRLPNLLQSLMDDAHAEHPRVRTVIHAVNLARHSANGWDDPAIPDDIADICKLLGITEASLMKRLRRMADIPEAPPPTAHPAQPDTASHPGRLE
ncbi:MAG: HDOD domain-containing protein [Rhodocyclaceae bacterium]|nr:HDOD domain-containing protein [Rhodocyclaceae bacterium]